MSDRPKPIRTSLRITNYQAQNGREELTPKQKRRVRKKQNRMVRKEE